jgi:hypothetical protein
MNRPAWTIRQSPLPVQGAEGSARGSRPLWRIALIAILAGLLVGCAGGAIRALDEAKDRAAAADWAALAAAPVPACEPADAVCAQRQALRARGCARMAEGSLSETARRGFLDCAVESGRAAIATADPPRAWREAYALALFQRRQARPGTEACQDNAPLLEQTELLRATGGDPLPRFLAASARLTAVTRCGAAPACATLSESRALLRDPPANALPQWQALAAGVDATARRLGCG